MVIIYEHLSFCFILLFVPFFFVVIPKKVSEQSFDNLNCYKIKLALANQATVTRCLNVKL